MSASEEKHDQRDQQMRTQLLIALSPEEQIALVEQKRQLAVIRYEIASRRGVARVRAHDRHIE